MSDRPWSRWMWPLLPVLPMVVLSLGCGVQRAPPEPRPECGRCHSAPGDDSFVDLGGSSDRTFQTVGAHEAHLTGTRFRAPLTCDECHKVPADLLDPGHVDDGLPAEVFTETAGIAFADGTVAAYDRAANTCTVYCHGAGQTLAGDQTPDQPPSWSDAADSVQCGSCHGLPPLDESFAHTGMTLTDCVTCHARSVDAAGEIKFDGEISTHMDGRVTGNR